MAVSNMNPERFEVLTAGNINILVLCNVTPCRLVDGYQRSGETCLHLVCVVFRVVIILSLFLRWSQQRETGWSKVVRIHTKLNFLKNRKHSVSYSVGSRETVWLWTLFTALSDGVGYLSYIWIVLSWPNISYLPKWLQNISQWPYVARSP
jgi:hypothetical protein